MLVALVRVVHGKHTHVNGRYHITLNDALTIDSDNIGARTDSDANAVTQGLNDMFDWCLKLHASESAAVAPTDATSNSSSAAIESPPWQAVEVVDGSGGMTVYWTNGVESTWVEPPELQQESDAVGQQSVGPTFKHDDDGSRNAEQSLETATDPEDDTATQAAGSGRDADSVDGLCEDPTHGNEADDRPPARNEEPTRSHNNMLLFSYELTRHDLERYARQRCWLTADGV